MSLLFILPPQYIPTLARQQAGLPSAVPPYLLAGKQVARLAAVQPDGLHPEGGGGTAATSPAHAMDIQAVMTSDPPSRRVFVGLLV